MKSAHPSREAPTGTAALPPHHFSEPERLRAEVRRLQRSLGDRESEIRSLRSRLAEVERSEAELRREERRRGAQKLESLGVLAGGIAHEFNNALVGILGYADLARSALPPHDPAAGSIASIEQAAWRAAYLARQMLAFSGRGSFIVSPLDLSSLIADSQHPVELSLPGHVDVSWHLAKDLPAIEADAEQLRQVLMSLVANAGEAISEAGGTVRIATGEVDCDRAELARGHLAGGQAEGAYVFLEVSDNGCGMDSETAARIFEPFFSTKFTGRGLGLAATSGIVRGHGGTLQVDSVVGRGTMMRALFPCTDPGTPADEPPMADCRSTVLAIDE